MHRDWQRKKERERDAHTQTSSECVSRTSDGFEGDRSVQVEKVRKRRRTAEAVAGNTTASPSHFALQNYV